VSELVGKTVLIGLTCLDRTGREIDRFQTFGTVEEVDERWIGVRRPGLSELFGLPPAPELFEPASTGTYTLDSTGERVEAPDLLVTLQITVTDPDSLLAIRGLGYVPQ